MSEPQLSDAQKFRNQFIRDFVKNDPKGEHIIPSDYDIKLEFEKGLQVINEAALQEAEKVWSEYKFPEPYEDGEIPSLFVWNFHHGTLIEEVFGGKKTIDRRLDEIAGSKPLHQRAVRLRNFRPVTPGTVTTNTPMEELKKAHQEQVATHADWLPWQPDDIERYYHGRLVGTEY